MRVVILAPHFAEYSLRLAVAMARRAKVLLLVEQANLRGECDPALIAQARAAVQLVEFDMTATWSRRASLLRILTAAALFRPDIVNIQEQIDKVTTWSSRLLRLFWPIALTVHDPQPHAGRDTDWVIENAGNRRSLRASARLFHVHGDFCRRQLATQYPGDARPIVVTTHGGILTPPADALQAPEPGRILMFGRMEAYKGLELLFDALDLLRARGRAFRLALIGRGPELDRLRNRVAEAADIELDETYLPPAAASAQFQRASIVVLPYTDATQSGVAAAAVANGRPMVASTSGGLPDAVTDGVDGLLFENGDAAALADRLEQLLCDPDKLQRLAEGVRTAAQTRFSWDVIAGALHEAFAEQVRPR